MCVITVFTKNNSMGNNFNGNVKYKNLRKPMSEKNRIQNLPKDSEKLERKTQRKSSEIRQHTSICEGTSR